MKKKIFNTRPEYFAHLVLILVILFISYPIGNSLFDFSSGYYLIKMFLWFFVLFYLSDNLIEYLLKV